MRLIDKLVANFILIKIKVGLIFLKMNLIHIKTNLNIDIMQALNISYQIIQIIIRLKQAKTKAGLISI